MLCTGQLACISEKVIALSLVAYFGDYFASYNNIIYCQLTAGLLSMPFS
jgi:hypothetical protein